MFTHIGLPKDIPEITRETTEAGRTYKTPEGRIYPSITTVVGLLGKEAIQEWRERVGEEEANKISTQASIRGTKVHNIAEAYVNNDPEWAKGHMPSNVATFNQMRPVLDRYVDNVICQEKFLWSDFCQTAGQVDLIADFNKKRSIIDFKTSLKKKKRSWIKNYFMQKSFYAVAFEERTGIPVKQLITLIAVDGEPRPQIFVSDRDDHFKDFMEIRIKYKEIKGI